MANIYITVEGDTFDVLALRFYHDEKMSSTIIQANPNHCDVLIFEAGIVLSIPDAVSKNMPESLPPWRRGG